MRRWLTVVILSGLGMASFAPAQPAASTKSTLLGPAADAESGAAAANLSAMPPLPRGRTTIFGGNIRAIDPVRDQLTLDVFGERPMRILYDERTAVFRNGKRIPLRDLAPAAHASVETNLDGTKLFAVSIHVLSEMPEGQYEGRILSFNPSTGELTVASGRSPEPFKMLVQPQTSIERKGQSTFASMASGPADLTPGALVSVEFGAAKQRQAVASRIDILAVPGTDFVFTGSVVSIDLPSGLLVLMDPLDRKNHQVFVDAAHVPAVEGIHLGDRVRVVASYDGLRYVASELAPSKP
jgi:hypothetical protein